MYHIDSLFISSGLRNCVAGTKCTIDQHCVVVERSFSALIYRRTNKNQTQTSHITGENVSELSTEPSAILISFKRILIYLEHKANYF